MGISSQAVSARKSDSQKWRREFASAYVTMQLAIAGSGESAAQFHAKVAGGFAMCVALFQRLINRLSAIHMQPRQASVARRTLASIELHLSLAVAENMIWPGRVVDLLPRPVCFFVVLRKIFRLQVCCRFRTRA